MRALATPHRRSAAAHRARLWVLRGPAKRYLAIVLCVLCAASAADARSQKTLAYTRDQAWPTAVRFIRVDENLKVLEKDADAGYVLFQLREDGRTFKGSLEVVDVIVEDHHEVRFVVSIEDRPSWVEIQMLRRLELKLRAELGEPDPPPAPKKKPDDKDKKGEGGKDEGAASGDKPRAEPSPTDDPPPQSPGP
jgi:hypothetical protein